MIKKNTKAKITKKKEIHKVANVHISISATFNNTIITVSNKDNGNVLAWASAGTIGFKGSKKGTPYAATTAMKSIVDKILEFKPDLLSVTVSGAGNGRDAALRALSGTGLRVSKIVDITPLPHNGCRPKKVRRP